MQSLSGLACWTSAFAFARPALEDVGRLRVPLIEICTGIITDGLSAAVLKDLVAEPA